MSAETLDQIVDRNPLIAQSLFDGIDGALNRVLPESGTHKRYEPGKPIGLAAVIAKTAEIGSYDPNDPKAVGRLAFLGENSAEYPAVWTPRCEDRRLLGGSVPEGIGRYTAFALAKISVINDDETRFDSFNIGSEVTDDGKIGLAGGIYSRDALVGVSGPWEVHGHMVAQVFSDMIVRAAQPDAEYKSEDDLAADFEEVFTRLKRAQDNYFPVVPANGFDRWRINALLGVASRTLLSHFGRISSP